MDVLHIELPRAFTTTVKPPNFRAARELAHRGIELDWVDANTHFWRFTMQAAGFPIDLKQFFDSRAAAAVAGLCRGIAGTRERCPLTPFGLNFGALANSTLNIPRVVEHPGFMSFVDEYAAALAARLELGRDRCRLLSFGVDSPHALVFGCALADSLRRTRAFRRPIVLGKASYENFNLRLRRQDILANAILGRYFDAVVYEDERFVEQVAMVLGPTPAPRTPVRAEPAPVLERSAFLGMLEAAPGDCVVLMPFSRNRCYWNRCSFCVQIRNHPAEDRYANSAEVTAASDEMSALAAAGFRYVIFNDEAMSPANIRRLCDALETRSLDIAWAPRIIADAAFDEGLTARMAQNGCVEALFGLETIARQTARAMGKVSHDSSPEAIEALLARFTRQGLGVFLNFIYGFPTESDEDFEPSFEFARHVRESLAGVTLQFNKFQLFYGTDVYREPARFGLDSVEPPLPTNDTQMAFGYVDRFGRRATTPGNRRYFAASLGMTYEEYAALAGSRGEAFVESAFQVNYASFGLVHKHRSGTELIGHCLA